MSLNCILMRWQGPLINIHEDNEPGTDGPWAAHPKRCYFLFSNSPVSQPTLPSSRVAKNLISRRSWFVFVFCFFFPSLIIKPAFRRDLTFSSNFILGAISSVFYPWTTSFQRTKAPVRATLPEAERLLSLLALLFAVTARAMVHLTAEIKVVRAGLGWSELRKGGAPSFPEKSWGSLPPRRGAENAFSPWRVAWGWPTAISVLRALGLVWGNALAHLSQGECS